MNRMIDPIVPGDMVRHVHGSRQVGLGTVLAVDDRGAVKLPRCALVMWQHLPGVRTEELAIDWYPVEVLKIHLPASNAGDT